jgi:uncharacterized protein YbjT (DUF2867 family)
MTSWPTTITRWRCCTRRLGTATRRSTRTTPGPEALSYADVAAELTTAMGRQISYVAAPDEAARQALLDAGLNDWFADALIGLYQDYRRSGTDGYAAQVTDTVERLTGRPARSLHDLLRGMTPI